MTKLLQLLFLFSYIYVSAQTSKVVVEKINAATLANSAGENPEREISVYLPPGYDASKKRYPVIYYLHGFQANHIITPEMQNILDSAIAKHKIKPFILVQANHFTLFEGSFYTNSSLTGNWADFEAIELVPYIDKKFRTIANRDSRAIAGHSMGGHGALKIAMLHPEIFSSVYALSPGLLALVKEFGPNSDSYKQLQNIKNQQQLNKSYAPKVLVAVGRAFSPNLNNPPFYCDMPFTYEGDKLIVDEVILAKWNENLPVEMIEKYAGNLRKLNAIKLDWGRNDASRFPLQCGMFSQKLENLGINHYAEEYIGDHGNKIWAADGRVFSDLLPFCNDNLRFE
ncbi:alpha/beta hydrolase [Flavobacterium selenitireducens]|uniref:alpha/beta hydrolase n=1 Tax=Flavobacterium selenitireducens TaxID=2722704 RepID=UPI00168B0AEA|nr:alpha/beta hydrolase-fold protein [Flavobacterium selenitireducens]MBD3584001.1 esterase family protein [Flavobacterium selenitireducens]